MSKLLRTRAVGAVTPSFAASVSDPSGVGTRDRTRPDESGRPSYVTAEGYRRLEEEAHRLWTVDRPRMAKAVEIAAAEGDRSENAEYQYSKRKLAEIDRRLRFLGKRLDVLKVVSEAPPEDGRVYFGTWVRLADRKGVEVVYRIVGPDEFDADRGWISVESPVAKALLKREEGDEVTVATPRGSTRFEIVEVSVREPAPRKRGRNR
ncbi:MAG: transcription elongation factor GreB [Polyangiales bacterium]